MMKCYSSPLAMVLLVVTLAFSLNANAKPTEDKQRAPSLLRSIVDEDEKGRVQTTRAKIEFDEEGRRIGNQVLDGGRRLIGRERFRYDRRGRLIGREYLLPNKSLKWRWTKVRHNDEGEPIANDIVNASGKRIGKYVWRYDEKGRLMRRDRLNADGTLRFYYGRIKFTGQGEFSEWTKYDAAKRKIGVKKWRYEAPSSPAER